MRDRIYRMFGGAASRLHGADTSRMIIKQRSLRCDISVRHDLANARVCHIAHFLTAITAGSVRRSPDRRRVRGNAAIKGLASE